MLDIAVRSAVERRGVAVLVVPGDILLKPLKDARPAAVIRFSSPVLRPGDAELDAAAEALNREGRVTILAGAGCAGAHDEVVAIAAALQAPVVHALRGKEFVEYDNPYDVGMTGLLGFSSGYRAMEQSEILLMLGTDFPVASSTRRMPRCCRSIPAVSRSGGARASTCRSSAPSKTRSRHSCRG